MVFPLRHRAQVNRIMCVLLARIFVSRPTVNWMGALGREIAAGGGQPAPSQLSDMQALSVRLERALYRTTCLLVLSLLAMAVARHL
jgi:hypothetical protein